MLKVASLFSGIGGVEVGLHNAGHSTVMFCEVDPCAQAVLRAHFPEVLISEDVQDLKSLPTCDMVAAGFPCQDLSLAGQKAGIKGEQSGLVDHLFRLLRASRSTAPKWLLFENVPYMLILDKSSAMRSLVKRLEAEGYNWAYRVVDARSFGVPQRRQRVILLASQTEDPRTVLFADDAGVADLHTRPGDIDEDAVYGFYWTMGKMGAGWAREATPPIKGGSGLGIPSPPAIWVPSFDFAGMPDIRDAERLQGLPEDWTKPVVDAGFRESRRWRLVGNAVCAKVAEWVGHRLNNPGTYNSTTDKLIEIGKWPNAAWGSQGKAYKVNVTEWPLHVEKESLRDFLRYPMKPLSARAAAGFRGRALVSKEIAWSPRFLDSLQSHIDRAGFSNANELIAYQIAGIQ